MATETHATRIAERLRAAVAQDVFPAAVIPSAQNLINRFDRPIYVALMGLPGSGKSAVLNLLAGETVVPEHLPLARLQLRQGPVPMMSLLFSNGTSDQRPGRDLRAATALGPMSITLDLPLQSLSLINPMELSPGVSDTDHARAITWAAKNADLFIWCSETFSMREQQLWQAAPNAVKDQGLLLITKTDLVGTLAQINTMVARLIEIAGDEFAAVLPLSTKLATQAFGEDGSVDRDLFRTSGAPSLIAEIRSQIAKVRQADNDTATMMLAQYADVQSTEATPATVVAPAVAKPPPVPQTAAASGQKPHANPEAEPDITAPNVAMPAAALQSAPAQHAPGAFSAQIAQRLQTPPAPTLHAHAAAPVSKDVPNRSQPPLQQGITALVDHATNIQSGLPASGKTQWSQIVAQSAVAVETVAKLLQADKGAVPNTILKDMAEIQDLLMLIQLEQGAAPAYDAISLMIQLKRDLEHATAA